MPNLHLLTHTFSQARHASGTDQFNGLGPPLTAHLGYEEGKDAPSNQPNRRKGTASKRLKGQDGEVLISVPRDRDGGFEPELVTKGQTRIDGME